MKPNFKTAALLALVILPVQMAVTWIFSKVLPGMGMTQVFGISDYVSPATAIGSVSIPNKIAGYLMGLLPGSMTFTVPNIVMTWIGAFILVMVGMYASEKIKFPKTTTYAGNVFRVLFWGTATLYVLLMVMGMFSVTQPYGVPVTAFAVPLAIGLIIDYLAVAFVTSKVAEFVPATRV